MRKGEKKRDVKEKKRKILNIILFSVLLIMVLFIILTFVYQKNYEKPQEVEKEGFLNAVANFFSFRWLFNIETPIVIQTTNPDIGKTCSFPSCSSCSDGFPDKYTLTISGTQDKDPSSSATAFDNCEDFNGNFVLTYQGLKANWYGTILHSWASQTIDAKVSYGSCSIYPDGCPFSSSCINDKCLTIYPVKYFLGIAPNSCGGILKMSTNFSDDLRYGFFGISASIPFNDDCANFMEDSSSFSQGFFSGWTNCLFPGILSVTQDWSVSLQSSIESEPIQDTVCGECLICGSDNTCQSVAEGTGCTITNPDDSVCDSSGNCVAVPECTESIDCLQPSGQCEQASCIDGVCGIEPKLSNSDCDDKNACTENDVCDSSGTCAGTPVDCDDDKECTVDSCNLDGSGCIFDDEPMEGQTCTITSLASLSPFQSFLQFLGMNVKASETQEEGKCVGGECVAVDECKGVEDGAKYCGSKIKYSNTEVYDHVCVGEKCMPCGSLLPIVEGACVYCIFDTTKQPPALDWKLRPLGTNCKTSSGKDGFCDTAICKEKTCQNLFGDGFDTCFGGKGSLNCCKKGGCCYSSNGPINDPEGYAAPCCYETETCKHFTYTAKDEGLLPAIKRTISYCTSNICADPNKVPVCKDYNGINLDFCCDKGDTCLWYHNLRPGGGGGIISLNPLNYYTAICGKQSCITGQTACPNANTKSPVYSEYNGVLGGEGVQCCNDAYETCVRANSQQYPIPLCVAKNVERPGYIYCQGTGVNWNWATRWCRDGYEICVVQGQSGQPTCMPAAFIVGSFSLQKSNSVYMIRDKGSFTPNGAAYVIKPYINFSQTILVTLDYSNYSNTTDLETYKYSDHDAVLNNCNSSLLGSLDNIVGIDGGVIELDEISLNIPLGALDNDVTFSIEKYNLSNCYTSEENILDKLPGIFNSLNNLTLDETDSSENVDSGTGTSSSSGGSSGGSSSTGNNKTPVVNDNLINKSKTTEEEKPNQLGYIINEITKADDNKFFWIIGIVAVIIIIALIIIGLIYKKNYSVRRKKK